MVSRIKEIISFYGLSDRQFALKCGIKQNTLSRQLSGTSEVSIGTIISILDSFDDVNAEWLMRGRGVMLISEQQNPELQIEKMERLVDTITTLQSALNEKSKTIQALEQEVIRLSKM